MAPLTAKRRNQLPDSAFAGPGRTYPDEDPSHARNALARAAQFASPKVEAQVRRNVEKKYPEIDVKSSLVKKRMGSSS